MQVKITTLIKIPLRKCGKCSSEASEALRFSGEHALRPANVFWGGCPQTRQCFLGEHALRPANVFWGGCPQTRQCFLGRMSSDPPMFSGEDALRPANVFWGACPLD
jgi:hypothetical protein